MLLRATLMLLVMSLPLTVLAQGAEDGTPEKPKTVEELSKELDALKTQVQELSDSFDEAKSLVEQLKQVGNDLQQLHETMQEQAARQEIALGSGSMSLSAKMQQDEGFRQEMRKVVNDSIAADGEVVVHNKMATQQRIKINQTEHVIPAGELLTVKVPVGTVTAQLPGKALTNWTVTAPTYRQTIDIVPRESVTAAYRPESDTTTTVTTLRPLSTLAPVYSSTPVYTPIYVQPYQYEYYDPFLGGWVRY